MNQQLEKDVASNAGVIPIYPWIENGKTKDNKLPNEYALHLAAIKSGDGDPGSIVRCNHEGCEGPMKSMFWRSDATSESVVPNGWTNYGGPGQFTICALCKAKDVADGFTHEALESGREDINLTHGSTGSTGSDRRLRPLTVSLPRPIPTIKNTERRTKMKLEEEARKLFKNHPKHLKAALQQINEDESNKRANAAESRKRKRKGGKKKRTKKRGRKNRKKRTKRRKVYKLKRKSTRKKRGARASRL